MFADTVSSGLLLFLFVCTERDWDLLGGCVFLLFWFNLSRRFELLCCAFVGNDMLMETGVVSLGLGSGKYLE